MNAELATLNDKMVQDGFWDDVDAANQVMKRKKTLEGSIENFQALARRGEDLAAGFELIEDEPDDELLKENMAELDALESDVERAELAMLFTEDADKADAICEINAGAGGTEAQDWAQMLLRMYLRWAESHDFEIEIFDEQAGEEAGIKSATFCVRGPNAYGLLKAEAGVHRLVRISPFDSAARRHTSFSSFFVYPDMQEDVEIEIDEKDLRVDTYRASGAGGQHVNKTDSAVRLTHLPTGIVVQCQNERSQHKNKAFAMKVLKARLYQQEMEKREAERAKLADEKMEIGWGSQIRSYVLQPYRMAKDHRTNVEIGDVDSVLNGRLDEFINGYLLKRKQGEKASA
ncbi:MAG: peptide chain release factor 2 [Deltaproteobacteria bacterium]|nr:peptide chain release factor 2 [Deltaproteobacteria bacterium]MCB9488392.1 peptide chain release factor 2 [Deltaproteobacteria bacterium]